MRNVCRWLLSWSLGMVLGWSAGAGEEPVAFPEFAELAAPVLFKPGTKVDIDRHGNYTIDGRPRFLLGAQVPNKIVASMAPTAGYPPELKWIYEQVLDYESAQRLGLDTVSYFAAESWIKDTVDPKYESYLFDPPTLAAHETIRRMGLPLQVDFTCAPWSHGLLAGQRQRYAGRVPGGALNVGGSMGQSNHWVPYSLTDPLGRSLYLAMWKSGAETAKASGGQVLMYELFNEPAYHDPSPSNRAAFARWLARRHGDDIRRLNAAWKSGHADFAAAATGFRDRSDSPGLHVDWSLFMEDLFLGLCREGMDTIRAVDPSARFCVQHCGADNYRAIPKNHVNLYEIAKITSVVSTATGGGGNTGRYGQWKPAARALDTPMPGPGIHENLLQRRFYRAIADGKPIHDGETYTGPSYETLHANLWRQLATGGNASYLFLWCKRAWDQRWTPPGSEEGGRRVAELMQFHILNPYAFPTRGLKAVMDVKREMLKVDDLFVPRENYITPSVGLLLSYPTERYAPAVGDLAKNEIRDYAAALEFTHHPYGVVLEEQVERFDPARYPVIVAAGVTNLYPATRDALRNYLETGGVFIAGLATPDLDEYGLPLSRDGFFGLRPKRLAAPAPMGELSLGIPASSRLPGPLPARAFAGFDVPEGWETVATLHGKPAVIARAVGKGKVYYVGARLTDYPLAALLDALLAAHGRRPVVEISDAGAGGLSPNVEMHAIRRGALSGAFLFNMDRYPKLARVRWTDPGSETWIGVDPLSDEKLPGGADGITVLLAPQQRTLVVAGPEAAIAGRFPKLTPVDAETLAARRDTLARSAAAEKEEATEKFRFNPDRRLTRPVDLRAVANHGFVDAVAGDGKGGWTDQGAENSLDGVPWGQQDFLGVPAEVIRFDENEDKTCLVLDSKNLAPGFGAQTASVALDQPLHRLYLFHAAAWSENGAEAYRLRVRYADGGALEVPVVCGREIGEWWIGRRDVNAKLNDRVAFANSRNRGFFGWCWENPEPEREVAGVDFVASGGGPIPVVVAMSAERYDPAVATTAHSLAGWKPSGWYGCTARFEETTLTATLAEPKDWCGFTLTIPPGERIKGTEVVDLSAAAFTFSVNGADDPWGRHAGGQSVQVYMGGETDGKKASSEKVRLGDYLTGRAIDDDPDTFQQVRIPLAKLFPKGMPAALATVSFQFTGVAPKAGIVVRDPCLELPAAALP